MILIFMDQLNKHSPVSDVDQNRISLLGHWFNSIQNHLPATVSSATASVTQGELTAVSGDASFRRYFRMRLGDQRYILMDAPPALESCESFIAIAQVLREQGVRVPNIFASDLEQGFLCLEDFGDILYWQKLDAARQSGVEAEVDALYQAALQQLLLIQGTPLDARLPDYDAAMLLREMQLFTDWLCRQLLSLELGQQEQDMFERLFAGLVEAARRQPQVFVHRDYHSRNLMYAEGQPPGILDFQDAVQGPFCYDLVSLLKDCYIAWPRQQVDGWALSYLQQARQAGLVEHYSEQDFLTDFDLMGVQRHLKAAGIFARLWLRDGKASYLKDIPRTLAHITALEGRYATVPGFSEFQDWCRRILLPAVASKLEPQLEQLEIAG